MPLIENNNKMNDDDNTIVSIQVTLTRSPLYGFGIAISGGNDEIDNQSLIISDVIKSGPADGKLLQNDRIVNVNGHPVVRYMEYTALKLIRESTDFVNLIVQRRKHPVILSDNDLLRKCILNKTRKDDKFGIIIDCRYFIKKIHYKNNEIFANIHEGDEVIKINEIPIDRLTLQEAQKLIDKTKEELILHTIPNKQFQFDLIRPNTGTRYISFFTETSSIGIRLAGGNKYGLFICEIQPNSVAYKSGLFIADKIFSVNNIDFTKLTREEAVLYLMNMKTSQVNMIVSNLPYEYEQLLADIGGDSFYIRAHFSCNSSNDEELSICVNDIFHVTDTLYNGQVGFWVVTKLNSISPQNKLTGAIPNKSRAEQLVDVAPNLGELIKLKQTSFKRKLRSKFNEKRSRSILSLNHSKDDSIFDKVTCWKPMINSKFSTYEQVILKPITIIRPVVLLGPLADIARDLLLNQYPDKFESPEIHIQSHTNIIKLQSIKNVIQKNRHCLLDITPSAIEQLNYTECYPIVIYFKISDRRIIKQIRNEYGKFYQKSSRRLVEISERLEHFYSYLFTAILKIDTTINWYELSKSQIEFQQEQPIWMSNDRSIKKDLLKSDEYFISTNYSDEYSISNQLNFDLLGKNYLQRVSSDPAMFKKNKNFFINLSYHNEEEYDDISMQTSTMSLPSRSHSVIEIPTTDKNTYLYQRSLPNLKNNHNHLFQPDKYITINRPKIIPPTNSLQINESSINRNSARRPLIAPKLRIINSNDHLSSSDSSGSIRKTLIDKSTMTSTENDPKTNLYDTWNKSTTISSNNYSSHNENLHRNTMVNSNDKFCTESLLKQKMCSSKKYNHTSVPSDHSKFSSLQKPRVYTYDDRNFSNQQQNILSSSSGSSMLSFKDKNIKEIGEIKSYSIQDGCHLIGSARGIIDYYGGKLSCPLTGVSLFIPMGAIPEGIQQEIYFQVCQDSSQIEKFHGQLLSPIVICGPQGIQFAKPVELILPHSAGNDAQQLSLMLHGTNQNSKTNFQQENKSFSMNRIHHVTNSNVSILVDHF